MTSKRRYIIPKVQGLTFASAEIPAWDRWLIQKYGPLLRQVPEDGEDKAWVQKLLGPSLTNAAQLAPRILPALAYQYEAVDNSGRMSWQSVSSPDCCRFSKNTGCS